MKSIRLNFLLILSSLGLFAQKQESEVIQDTLSTITLEEVKLIGIRANENTPVTYTNVNRKEIQSRNLGQDIPILLNFLPAVVTTSDAGSGIGYTGIRVRGSDATRVNVTVNGIPFNDAESQGTFWVNLPDFASSVEQIQLQRGVGTSSNGSAAFGASLNLETDKVRSNSFASLSTSLGSFNTIKNTLQFSSGTLNNVFAFSGRISKINTDGYVDRASSDLDGYFFQATFQDENTLIKGLFFGGHEVTYQSWHGIDSAKLSEDRTYNPAGEIYNTQGGLIGFYENQVDDYRQDHYQLHLNEKINSFWNFSVGLNYTHGRGFYEEYNNLSSSDASYDYLQLVPYQIGGILIERTDNISQKWLDNDYYVLTLGLNYKTPKTMFNFGGLYSRYIGDHFGNLIWEKNIGDILPNHHFYKNQGVKIEGSFFAKATKSFSSDLTAFLDLQLRSVKYTVEGKVSGPAAFSVDDHFLFFNPKTGLTYALSQKQNIYFSYAKAQREPNRTDYENGAPKPEKLNDFELGWRFKKDKVKAQANMYWMEYKDQLVLTGAIDEVGAPIRQNIGESRRVGLEVEVKVQLANQWLWQPNIALSKNQNLDFYFKRDGQLQSLGKTELAYSPNLVAGNTFLYAPSNRFQLGLLTKYVGKQYMGNIDAESSVLDSYFISDLNAVFTWQPKKWVKKIQWSLMVNNLFNVLYQSNGYFYTYDDSWSNPDKIQTIEGAGYYPQAEINFLTGLQIEF